MSPVEKWLWFPLVGAAIYCACTYLRGFLGAMAADIRARRRSKGCGTLTDEQKRRDQVAAYQDALIGMFVQAGLTASDGEIDTNQISVSAYEQAFEMLKRDGRAVERKVPCGLWTRRAWFFTDAEWVGAGCPDDGSGGE